MHVFRICIKMKTSTKYSVFNDNWPLDAIFYWAERVPENPRKCKCTLCKKTFALSNMGRAALMSHMAREKHKTAVDIQSKSHTIKHYYAKRGSGI